MPGDLLTRVAVLTPQGRGAVAVVAVQGPLAEAAVNRHFHPANQRSIDQQAFGRIVFGRWSQTNGEEVVICRREMHSVEVHCHGGLAASAAIVHDLEQAGCQTVSWTEVVADSDADPICTAARVALAEARTERTATILLDQYRGALRTALAEIERLARSPSQSDRDAELRKIGTLLSRADVGGHLTIPWRIAIAGPPNVGKSSLINALVGYERAIVFDLPGTTRDVVTALTAFNGWPVELADTAGLRTATDEVESAGVALAEAQIASADLAILVFSLADAWSDADRELADRYPRALIVHNKLDLADREDARPAGVRTSAVTGWGLKELERAVVERLAATPLQPGDAVPFAPEQVEHLQALQARLTDTNPKR